VILTSESLHNSVSRQYLKEHALRTTWLKIHAVFSLVILRASENCVPRTNTLFFYKDDQVKRGRGFLDMHNIRAHILAVFSYSLSDSKVDISGVIL